MSASKGKFAFLRSSKSNGVEPAESPRTQTSEKLSTQPSDRRRGRPNGKRTDENYTQVTAYILRETHLAVKLRLMKEQGGEFSELVQELLEGWLKT